MAEDEIGARRQLRLAADGGSQVAQFELWVNGWDE
jgi:hypothetical protein